MTVHIGQVNNEVVAAPSSADAGPSAPEPPWLVLERSRTVARRLHEDRIRTAARGFDD
jgi:hypothetical protein